MDNVSEATPYATNIQTETQIDTLTSDTLIFDIPSNSICQLDRGGQQSEQYQGGSGLADTLDPSIPPSQQDQSSLPRLEEVQEYLETLAPLPVTSSTLLNDADPFLSSSGRMFTSEPQRHQEGFASHQEDTLVDYFNQTEGPLELERIWSLRGNKTPRKIEVHCEPQDIVSPGHNTPGWYR